VKSNDPLPGGRKVLEKEKAPCKGPSQLESLPKRLTSPPEEVRLCVR
jgi:hypothetical protein